MTGHFRDDTVASVPFVTFNALWWQWVEETFGVSAETFRFTSTNGRSASLSGVVFLNRRGRILTPPLNSHVPMFWQPSVSGSKRLDSQTREWLELSGHLAGFLKSMGIVNSVALPPGFIDARAFTWAGLRAGLSYTYLIDFPRDETLMNVSVRKRIRKAKSLGYQVSRSDDWREMWRCFSETGERQKFENRVSLTDLQRGERIMGSDMFRGYVVRDNRGTIVSSGVRIHSSGHVALDLLQGTLRHALPDGVAQLMYDFVFSDLHGAGATGIDLAGANISSVAAAKSSWGYPLVPQIRIEMPSPWLELRKYLARSKSLRRAARNLGG